MIGDVRTRDTRCNFQVPTVLVPRKPIFFCFEVICVVNLGLRERYSNTMVRAPYFDRNGIKKGAWNEEEDQRLIAYVEKHGHPNWRQLPKFAGILYQ